jgi:hypothetical protein
MRLVNINTTAFEEEDFLLLTDLNDDDLYEVIMPMVNAERDGEVDYDRVDIVSNLMLLNKDEERKLSVLLRSNLLRDIKL